VTKTHEDYSEQKVWTDAQQLGENAPVLLSVSVSPSSVGSTLSDLERIADQNQLGFTAWGRIGLGSLFFAFDAGMAESYVSAINALRRSLPRDASAVVTRCPAALKSQIDVWGASPTHLESMAAVKRSLNPKDTLNRGRFLL